MFAVDAVTVLLVEDEAIIALNQKATLEKNGLTVHTAHSAESALAMVDEDESITLILMDIDLGGGMDGTEAAQRILKIRDLPIIFLTSHAEKEMVRKVEGITQYGYVLKSSGEFVLIQAIRNALNLFDAHSRLKQSERRYRTMVETAPMPFQSLNAEGRLIDVNSAWLRTLGYRREEVLGSWFGELLHPSQVDLFRERFPRFKSQGTINGVEFLMRRSDGSYITTLFNGCIAYTAAGTFSHTVCVFQDITERKRAEAAHLATEHRLQKIFDSAPIGIGIVKQRVIEEANDRVGEMVGRSREELLGSSVRILYETEEEYRRVGLEKYRQMDESGAGTVQTRWRRRDGTVIDVLVSSAPIEEDGPGTRVIFTAFDITEYKQGERSLQRALEEKEQLMRELNHRVKNNLNMVSSLINLKEADLKGQADLSDIQNQLDAIRTVHEKLAQTDGALTINLKSYLSDLLTSGFHWPYSAPHPEIRMDIAEAVVPAKTAASLGLIVNELATNAAKHAFQDVHEPRLSVEFSVNKKTGEYLLKVSNNGNPFPEHITPDEPATGGLGLQLISAMVAGLEGEISLRREPETTITVRIPAPYLSDRRGPA